MTTEFRTIPLSDIGESPLNPRSHYDLEDLEELSASIAEVGILEPLLVRPRIRADEPREPGRFFPFEIVAGHRRKRAAHMAGLVEVPCLVRDLDDAQAIECALVENGQRADVTPMDEAGAFAELVRLGRSEAAIAAKIGRSRRAAGCAMRPWRLTRRARVEMEWTLACLRGQVDADKHCEMRLRCTETVEDAAWGMLDDGAELVCWPEETASLMFPRSRHVRILRARVALALRAALRADEDARCEEAYCVAYERSLSLRSYTLAEAAHAGAWQAIRALRSWPTETRDGETVPLALWEVVR